MFWRRFFRPNLRNVFVWTSCLVWLTAPEAMGQELPNFELFGGYTLLRPDGGQANLNGAYAGFAAPVNSWFGVAAEISGVSGAQTLSITDSEGQTIEVATDVNFVSLGAGPRLTYRGERLSPFVHTLFGIARGNWQPEACRHTIEGTIRCDPVTELPEGIAFGSVFGVETSFAAAVGGGLDARLADIENGIRVDFRMFQAEWVLTRFGEGRENNFRISTGLTFSF